MSKPRGISSPEPASEGHCTDVLTAGNPRYRVQVAPVPTVIDEKGEPILDAFIVAIHFPRRMTATELGQLPVLIGAGAAKILVGDAVIRSVPLC